MHYGATKRADAHSCDNVYSESGIVRTRRTKDGAADEGVERLLEDLRVPEQPEDTRYGHSGGLSMHEDLPQAVAMSSAGGRKVIYKRDAR